MIGAPIKKSTLFLFLTLILSSGSLLAQSPDVSGMITIAGVNGEQYNGVSIKFEVTLVAIDETNITRELNKYPGIASVSFLEERQYIYVKYTNEISANQLLAVLDKLNKRGHYMNAGLPVYYQKDQNTYFLR